MVQNARWKCYMAKNVHVERLKVQTMNAQKLDNDHHRDYPPYTIGHTATIPTSL